MKYKETNVVSLLEHDPKQLLSYPRVKRGLPVLAKLWNNDCINPNRKPAGYLRCCQASVPLLPFHIMTPQNCAQPQCKQLTGVENREKLPGDELTGVTNPPRVAESPAKRT
jgi:hypothetical protein